MKNTKATLIALHGFLGAPADWDLFSPAGFGVEQIIAYPVGRESPTFEDWAARFNNWVETSTYAPRFLMGYSMGGRLALHSLVRKPELWKGAFLLSTHPGTENNQDRYLRDCQWADRFLKEPWELLMRDWENQPVFKNARFRFKRRESEENRLDAAHHLQTFSLGLQGDLRHDLRRISIPIMWMTGCEDTHFSQLAAEIAKGDPFHVQHELFSGSHRFPWEDPEGFQRSIKTHLILISERDKIAEKFF